MSRNAEQSYSESSQKLFISHTITAFLTGISEGGGGGGACVWGGGGGGQIQSSSVYVCVRGYGYFVEFFLKHTIS